MKKMIEKITTKNNTKGYRFRKDLKGFSLIELVIAVAIMAVFAAWMVPSFMHLREESKQKKDMTKIEAVCDAFQGSLGEEEVVQEIESWNAATPENVEFGLIYYVKVGEDGLIDFSKGALTDGTLRRFSESKLWGSLYQAVGKTYQTDSKSLLGKYLVCYLKPKTSTARASCEYMILETLPTIRKCTIKLGIYTNESSAESLVRQLQRDGFNARVDLEGRDYVVYVGKYRSVDDAKVAEDALLKCNYAPSIILL